LAAPQAPEGSSLWARRYWALLERWDPGGASPRDLFADRILELAPGGLWLDAGCGRSSFPEWRSGDEDALRAAGTRLVGCDEDLAAVKDRPASAGGCGAALEQLPFPDGTFDLVSCNMVFEHLVDPEAVVGELSRVVAPGGRILIHTVNAWHYLALLARVTPFRFHQWLVGKLEGRSAADVYPTKYRANTERRLRRLFARHGCRHVDGGAVADLPLFVPYRGIFWLACAAGLVERRLARLPVLGTLARPNLLIEFLREPGGRAGAAGVQRRQT
jgi:SAM-dependent methyltransferase